MEISTFQFKRLFNFLSDSLNTNIVFIISENIKLFHETFRNFFIFWTIWYIHNTTFFGTSKKPGGMMQSSVSSDFFLKVINDTIDKSMWIVSIKKILLNF